MVSAARGNQKAAVGQAVTATLATAAAGFDGSTATNRSVVFRARADVSAFLGHVGGAAADYLASAQEAARSGDTQTVGELCLRLATVTWDPALAARVTGLIDDVIDRVSDPALPAELRLCRSGGLYRSAGGEHA